MNDMTAWGHILVAEDNPVSQRVTRAMLENLGFHVDVVADGAEAVNAAATTPYRAILLDCQLPVLDGYLAASEIRRWQGASRRTPIIAVTASAKEADEQRCLAAGMDDYLTKPLTLKALASVLAQWAPDALPDTAPPSEVHELAVGTPHVVNHARPALDPEVVDRLEQLGESAGEDLVGQLAILFVVDADLRVVELRDAVEADDAMVVFRAAHALRGASSNLGATDLARLCAALADESEVGDLERGTALVDGIELELARVRMALDARSLTP